MYFVKIILLALLSIFIIGCGDNENNTITQVEEVVYPSAVSNSGKTTSLLGYYGDDVYLGDQKIVGEWHAFYVPEDGSDPVWDDKSVTYHFNSDGTGESFPNTNSSGGPTYFVYGLQGSWDLLLSNGDYDTPSLPLEILNVNGYKDGCFQFKHTDAYGSDNYQPFYLCKIE